MTFIAQVTEVAVTNLQTFLLYLFLPKVSWYWLASIWGIILFIALFGAFFIREKWGRTLSLCANVLINALGHPIGFLVLYASSLFYYFSWYRDMYIIARNVPMTIALYFVYIAAVVLIYLIFLAIEFWFARKMKIVRKWDGFLSFILPAHRGYVFAALIVLFGTGRVIENVFVHYLIYRVLGLLYFIVIVYLNMRALIKKSEKAVIKTIAFVLFEIFFLAIAMAGAVLQTGKPGYIEAYLKSKGIDFKK